MLWDLRFFDIFATTCSHFYNYEIVLIQSQFSMFCLRHIFCPSVLLNYLGTDKKKCDLNTTTKCISCSKIFPIPKTMIHILIIHFYSACCKTPNYKYLSKYLSKYLLAGNALARVQRVHTPADLWDTTFCTRRILIEILKYSKNFQI